MKNILLLLSLFSTASLFAENGAPAREGNFMQTLIMIGIAIVFFYFILWRPERKRRKALKEQREMMKKGDRVTAMGIVGSLDEIKDTTIVLKMIDGAKIEVLKAAISEVQPAGAPAPQEEAKQ